jgi:ABC-2 type transport system permease protein
MTHFNFLIRGVMLRGAGLHELLPSVAALVVFTIVVMAIAILNFSKRLD